MDTQAHHFGFTLLDTRKTGRIHPMFPAAKALYKEVRKHLEAELRALEKAVNGTGAGANVPLLPLLRKSESGLFAAITAPREGVICYPVKGRRMADDMTEVLKALQDRFIERHLLPPNKAVEQDMTQKMTQILRDARVLAAYQRNVKLGTDEFMVPFAFVHMAEGLFADRALRPLNFDLETPTEIYNHGDEWLMRLNRLTRNGYCPSRCLFALRPPCEIEGLKKKAFDEIREAFLEKEFEAPLETDVSKIVEFARIEENTNLRLADIG